MKKNKILITGASGYLGARLYFDLSKPFEVVGTYNNLKLSKDFIKLDVTNELEVDTVFEKEKPEIIIHTVALASTKKCEENPDLAKKLNETSTKNVVDSANKIGAKVIFISTFATFEQKSVYAKTKYNAELYVKKTKAGWTILRPSVIMGFSPNTVNERPFTRILKSLDGLEVEYDTLWKFQPTYIGHVSEVIKEVIINNLYGEIIPVAVEDLKSSYEIAKNILAPFGVSAKSFEANDSLHFSEEKDTSKLNELNLPTYTYNKMVEKIIDEIKNRGKYKLI